MWWAIVTSAAAGAGNTESDAVLSLLEAIQHRRQHLMQTGERELHLRLDARGAHDSAGTGLLDEVSTFCGPQPGLARTSHELRRDPNELGGPPRLRGCVLAPPPRARRRHPADPLLHHPRNHCVVGAIGCAALGLFDTGALINSPGSTMAASSAKEPRIGPSKLMISLSQVTWLGALGMAGAPLSALACHLRHSARAHPVAWQAGGGVSPTRTSASARGAAPQRPRMGDVAVASP